ncbi:AAA family ATPase [Haliangium ochraceum]|uniref:ATP-binding protein n=1 Tax=Haliangium ochraceum (strain DSM 14365 / JCM 11303 / SMP-2) TaxID=502025 RepID=D0LYS1_HALO1|nr:AAA family ATPase [Haliangium ochraceum]ACY17937.1 ATP-binding protein [Haliangium ochraceum DSM 14365]
MKIRSIQIDRFTAFEHIEAEFSPGLNVFIGANATGKSHLLKLLYAPLKTLEQSPHRRGSRDREELALKVREKLEGVFRPEDERSGRLVRRTVGRDHARAAIVCDDGKLDFELSTLGSLTLKPHRLPTPETCLFLPSREFLSAYEGFIAAYQSRELSIDETYYDLCVALSASPLRGARGREATELLKPLTKALPFKVVLQNGRFYITAPKQGKIEAHLVAEGYRKIASIIHLVNNGALAQNGIIFWDEPEANLNPQLIVHVARLLMQLAGAEVQVFVATHDYLLASELSLAAEYLKPEARAAQVRFFCLNRPARDKSAEIEFGNTLADLRHNPIFEEFAAHHERERELFYHSEESDR